MPEPSWLTEAIKRRLGLMLETQGQQPTAGVPQGEQPGSPVPVGPPPAQQPAPQMSPPQSINDYDFDPEYDTTMRTLIARQNFLNSQYTQGRNRVNTSYQIPLQELQQQQGVDTQRLAGQMADQGITRSSNNLFSQGQLSQAYQRRFGGLALEKQQQEEQLDRQRAEQMQQILEEQITAQGRHTQYVGEKEKERAANEAQAKALEDALKRQQEMNSALQAEAEGAKALFNNMVNPPVVTTPTGQIVPAQQQQQGAPPAPWNNAPPGWLDDLQGTKKLWW